MVSSGNFSLNIYGLPKKYIIMPGGFINETLATLNFSYFSNRIQIVFNFRDHTLLYDFLGKYNIYKYYIFFKVNHRPYDRIYMCTFLLKYHSYDSLHLYFFHPFCALRVLLLSLDVRSPSIVITFPCSFMLQVQCGDRKKEREPWTNRKWRGVKAIGHHGFPRRARATKLSACISNHRISFLLR